MRADEYVVEQLVKEQTKNQSLMVANSVLREDNYKLKQKHELVCSLFSVEKIAPNSGYAIHVVDTNGSYKGAIAYAWTTNPDEIPLQFMTLLDALGLQLPSEPNDQSDGEPQEQEPTKSEHYENVVNGIKEGK